MYVYDFGKRNNPCGDCDTDGHCTMNCGPRTSDTTDSADECDELCAFLRSAGSAGDCHPIYVEAMENAAAEITKLRAELRSSIRRYTSHEQGNCFGDDGCKFT